MEMSVRTYLKNIGRLGRGYQPLFLDYAVDFKPRWAGPEGNPHLAEIIASGSLKYQKHLSEIAEFATLIPKLTDPTELQSPVNWRNGMLPALDGLSLMWAARRATANIVEVGSGNSTQFLRAALHLTGSAARLTSIDPAPRVGIDALCDVVLRSPVENIDLDLFDELRTGDVVFFDNSHRSFMNSDVTVAMLDILPRLPRGVLVGFHDIFLPFDYFESWSERGYNEQYLLAAFLLGGSGKVIIELANYWAFRNNLHLQALREIWRQLGDEVRDRPPSAFWLSLT